MTSKNIFFICLLINIFCFLNLDSGLCGSKPKIYSEGEGPVYIRGVLFPCKDEKRRQAVFVNRAGVNITMMIGKQWPVTIPKGCKTVRKVVYKDEVVVFQWREKKDNRLVNKSAVLPGELIVCERIKLCWDCGDLDFKPDFNPKRVKVKPVVTTGAAAHGPMVTGFDKKEELDDVSIPRLLEASKAKLLTNVADSDSDLEI